MGTAENPGGHCDGHSSRPVLANQTLYPVLLEMLTDYPVILSARINLLQLPSDPHWPHRLHKPLRILVCKDPGCNMQTKAFQMKLLTSSCHQAKLKQRNSRVACAYSYEDSRYHCGDYSHSYGLPN